MRPAGDSPPGYHGRRWGVPIVIIKSLDTETTGVDRKHGASIFLVSMCDQRRPREPYLWRWDVDPLTRRVKVPISDLKEIQNEVDECDRIYLQNGKFDIPFLRLLYKQHKLNFRWDWRKAWDTLIGAHLLRTDWLHDLTTSCLLYLNVDISKYEQEMKKAVKECRNWVRSHEKNWAIAKKGRPDMPSAGEETWKYDLWLPLEVAMKRGLPDDHYYRDCTTKYSAVDAEVTLPLGIEMERLVKEKGLDKIFKARMDVLPSVECMEDYGVTLSEPRTEILEDEYQQDADKCNNVCVNIAKSMDYDLTLPKSGVNKSLTTFAFDVMKLPVVHLTDGGNPSLDSKIAIPTYQATLPRNSRELRFIVNLKNKRKRDTALTYMKSYRRYWLPVPGEPSFRRLFPSINPTGTGTLRFSSSNPNEQNISKQGMLCIECDGVGCDECEDQGVDKRSLRYLFGPAPGREWWSFDAKNIELRLPAYEAGETEMINLFERPDDPPYYGSNHLLVFDIIYPELFAKHGAAVKDLFKATNYKWIKEGNFAVQYGALPESGTADRAYRSPGAQLKVMGRFTKIAELNQKMIAIAEERGYVETMPDKSVDPTRGYPIYCERTQWGRIRPTVPLNYHVQGTAMWWMMRAMTRCHAYLQSMEDYHLIMQIHDELVFDFPAGSGLEPWKTNLPVARRIASLMEQGGDDIGVPTPVGCEYHAENYSVGMAV